MKKNILQTFEDFLREPLSILKKTFIHITGVDTFDGGGRSITVEKTSEGIQVNIINSQNTYNLLSSVMYKKQISELRHLINENKKSEISQEFSGPKISARI